MSVIPVRCDDCHHPTDDHSRVAGCLETLPNGDSCPCKRTLFIAPTPTRAQSIAATDSAVDQATAAADAAEFVAHAHQAVAALAAARRDFTVDDVWDYLRATGVPAPREPRALGGVIRRAVREGVIRADGYTPSRRRHQAPVRVYRRPE